jgi:hypothetical protein
MSTHIYVCKYIDTYFPSQISYFLCIFKLNIPKGLSNEKNDNLKVVKQT